MGFFKRPPMHPHAEAPPSSYSHLPQMSSLPHSQRAALDTHRLAELQNLSKRMETLQMQMEQLAASVQTNRAATSSMKSTGTALHTDNRDNTVLPASQHPGPCPFPASEGESRFVEIDESTREAGQAASGAFPSQTHSSRPSVSTLSQEVLEQLLREGAHARTRSASPAHGSFATQPEVANIQPGFVERDPTRNATFSNQVPVNSYNMPNIGTHTRMPAWKDSTMSQGIDASFEPMSGAGIPGFMASQFPSSRAASLHIASPFPQGPHMHNEGFGHIPGQVNSHLGADMPRSHQGMGYQFPNAFGLEQGPHRPGFGNSFTMQQMPSPIGQIGAHFSRPTSYNMGMPAHPRSASGFR